LDQPDEAVAFLDGERDEAVGAVGGVAERVGVGDGPERAVRVVGPAVISAGEDPAVAGALVFEAGAPMAYIFRT